MGLQRFFSFVSELDIFEEEFEALVGDVDVFKSDWSDDFVSALINDVANWLALAITERRSRFPYSSSGITAM